jgi:hypothetical protein
VAYIIVAVCSTFNVGEKDGGVEEKVGTSQIKLFDCLFLFLFILFH